MMNRRNQRLPDPDIRIVMHAAPRCLARSGSVMRGYGCMSERREGEGAGGEGQTRVPLGGEDL